MKHLLTFSLTLVLLALAQRGTAQNSYLENSPVDLRLVGGTTATNPNNLTHSFLVRGTTSTRADWSPVLRVTNAGRVGIGYDLTGIIPSSRLNVGTGANGFSVDELWETRYNSNLNTFINGVTRAGVCIGFNATRQTDAAIGCAVSVDPVTFASTGRNGGALIWADDEGTLTFTNLPSHRGLTGPASGTDYYYPDDVPAYRVMKIKASRQVIIGLDAPTTPSYADYRLAVDGKLVAKSIFVAQLAANWADFVFEPTYALKPLPELEAYLKQNHHLPAIPSAVEVEQNGIDVAVMNAKLLQSLEELTLHVIELGKQNQQLQANMAVLAAKVNQTAAPAVGK